MSFQCIILTALHPQFCLPESRNQLTAKAANLKELFKWMNSSLYVRTTSCFLPFATRLYLLCWPVGTGGKKGGPVTGFPGIAYMCACLPSFFQPINHKPCRFFCCIADRFGFHSFCTRRWRNNLSFPREFHRGTWLLWYNSTNRGRASAIVAAALGAQ